MPSYLPAIVRKSVVPSRPLSVSTKSIPNCFPMKRCGVFTSCEISAGALPWWATASTMLPRW